MKEIDMNAILSQLRANAAMAKNGISDSANGNEGVNSSNFSDLLKTSIDKVNSLQKQSGDLKKAFEVGDPNTSLAEVMIAGQKAGIAFQSVLQVRNKLLSAYQDIMSMSV